MEKVRIAHISDLHFSKITLSPSQFFSKRWIGNLNLLLLRRNAFQAERVEEFFLYLKENKVDFLVITGDLSSTSLKEEFAQAREFVCRVEMLGTRVIVIPGNHDHYTRRSWKDKVYYNYFPESFQEKSAWRLKEDGMTVVDLSENWALVALDTALATSWTSSCGLFSQKHEMNISRVLRSMAPEKQVIVINHFPLFDTDQESKILKRAEVFRDILKEFSNVRFYLHGHTHRHSIADLTPSGLPIVLDSGSLVDRCGGYFHLIDLFPKEARLTAFQKNQKQGEGWLKKQEMAWSFHE